ncbi:MAG: hypothetical protein ACTHOO_02200 [Alcanivorax sp.]
MQVIQNKQQITEEEHKIFSAHMMRWFDHGSAVNLPEKDDFKYGDILMPYRVMATLEDGRVKYHEAGDQLERLYGAPVSGKYADELYNKWFSKIALQNYSKSMDTKSPVYESRQISTIIKKIGYEKLILPIGTGDDVSSFITYILPLSKEIRTRKDWQDMVDQTPWLGA